MTQHGKGSFVAEDPRLDSKLYKKELDEYLEKAIHLADLLGMSSEKLMARLQEALALRRKETHP